MKFSPKHLLLLAIFLISINSACKTLTQEERRELMRTNQEIAAPIIVALNQYHVDNGKYPEDLSLLIPQFLAEIPKPTTEPEFSYGIWGPDGDYLLGFSVEKNSGCGYRPRFEFWDCGFGD